MVGGGGARRGSFYKYSIGCLEHSLLHAETTCLPRCHITAGRTSALALHRMDCNTHTHTRVRARTHRNSVTVSTTHTVPAHFTSQLHTEGHGGRPGVYHTQSVSLLSGVGVCVCVCYSPWPGLLVPLPTPSPQGQEGGGGGI